MRKGFIALAVVAILAGAIYAFWPRGTTSASAEEEGGSAIAAPGEAAEPALAGKATPTAASPQLARRATLEEGLFRVTVEADGAPRPGAQVKLYWRGARDPNTDLTDWRLAGAGITDSTGVVQLPAAPGEYLIAARSAPLAPARRAVARPQGEHLTAVTLQLSPGATLLGRTVEKKGQSPVPLVELSLTPLGRGAQARSAGRATAPTEEVSTASSDSRGEFRIEGLAQGPYRLQALAPGHTGYREVVEVAAGMSPVVVPLAAAGVIEGFVRLPDGRPAAGAEVSAVGGKEAPATGVSGSEGGFSLEVPAGRWQVTAKLLEQAGSAEGVVVASGGTVRGVEVRLDVGGAVAGNIHDKVTGAPLPGARVDLSPHGFTGDSGRGVSGAEGGYRVSGLPPGSYDVVVNAPGHGEKVEQATVRKGETFSLDLQLDADGTLEGTARDTAGHALTGVTVVVGEQVGRTDGEGRYQVTGLAAGTHWVAARKAPETPGVGQRVEIRAGETAHADFELADSATLTGRVNPGSAGNTVTKPLAALCRPHARAAEFVTLEVEPSGAFHQELPAATYSCWASYFDGSSRGPAADVTLEAGRTATVDLALGDSDSDAGVLGTVHEPDGTPSPGAQVLVRLGNSGPSFATADDEGRVTLPLTPGIGPVKISARNGGRMVDTSMDRLPAQFDVVLQGAAVVRGRVVPRDGAPVAGFVLSAELKSREGFRGMGGSGGPQQFSGDHFELTDLPADVLVLNATARDGRTGGIEVTGQAGATVEVDIPLDAAGTVRGRVIGSTSGQPLASVGVIVDDAWSASVMRTAADGTFSVPVAGGAHKLQWFAPEWTASVRRVTVASGQVIDLGDISLIPIKTPVR